MKSEIMIEMNTEPEQQKIKLSLYSCVIEAEKELKFSSDMDAFLKAKSILLKVLEDDSLNFKALLNLAYISICYENNPLEGLDYLLRAKLINPNSHQLWNLLGHAYWFIDGVGDKADEWFTEASVVQLEHPDWIELAGIIPFVI